MTIYSLKSISFYGGLAKNKDILKESEPYCSTNILGFSPLNLDFDIF
jgi:hypothetical protein